MNQTPVITAFLDANVLYPALLRDILLRLASQNLFHARWSKQVHDEWMAALMRDRPDISSARMERTRHLMDTHFKDALVEGYEHLIEKITLPDPDDRHVLTAAIHGGARIIVTTNLRDFPETALAGFDVEAMHPDASF
jgi:predicted nucleic acid-binding protein